MDVRHERTGPARVLCGDGDATALEALVATLAGHESLAPEGVSDRETVLERLADDEPVDCVVCGGGVDGGSRLDVLAAVRDREPDLPVVFYPRDPTLEEASEATAHDATTYLPRSMDPSGEAVRARVADAVETYDRRREERRDHFMFRSLLESVPISVHFKDREGRHVAVSAHIDSSVERDPIGKTDVELWQDSIGDLAQIGLEEDVHVVETGEPMIDKEVRNDRPDGTTSWFRSTKLPWRDEDGEILGVIGITRNVTEIKEREADLERQKRLLEQFASFVSHDLRNPINVAQGYLDLARAGDEDAIEEVDLALERMEALIEDLLKMAREEPGSPSTEWVPVRPTVEEVWEATDAEEATLVLDLPETVFVRAATGRFRQLLENLLENAVEHAGPDVTVTVGLTDTGFYVEDDGPGIDAEDPNVVFEFGYTEGGTGIGLAIANEVAESHGWEAAVENRPGGGARFTFDRCLLDVPSRRDVAEGAAVPLTESANVDDAAPVGAARYDDERDTWTVTGGGLNFWGAMDEYYTRYATVDGDVRIVARVRDLEPIHEYSKAGILCCASPERGSPLGFIGATAAHGTETLGRRTRDETIDDHHFPEIDGLDRWYRLDRIGEIVTCFTSTDGEEWTVVDQLAVDAPETVAVGLAVCSHNSNRLCEATFGDVRVTPLLDGE